MRIARFTSPGVVHHVICRFIDRDWLVSSDDQRAHYLELLGHALEYSDWRCLAYALMSNHFHFAMVAGEMPCESWTRRTNPPFARWLNKRRERIGPVFAGRARIWSTRPEHVGALIAYIHNNPVRAGLVASARESRWTSHHAYVSGDRASKWLAVDEGLARAGLQSAVFGDWVDQQVGIALPDHALQAVQRAVHARGTIELATPQRDPLNVPLLARPFAVIRPDPVDVIEIVASIVGIAAYRLRGRGADGTLRQRALAVQVAKASGLTYAAIGAAMGQSPPTASRLGRLRLNKHERAAFEVAMRRLYVTPASRERNEKASPSKGLKLLSAGATT